MTQMTRIQGLELISFMITLAVQGASAWLP
jgi:hypothetical protein